PEGGYYALPDRKSGDGLLITGDAAGFVEVASLKGIHYAMHSGMLAARAIFNALKTGDSSARSLAAYDRAVAESYVVRDLYARRNMRLAFQRHGFFVGVALATLMTVTGGRFPAGRTRSHADADVPRAFVARARLTPDGRITFSKVDANYKSGNATRDDIPSHLLVPGDVPADVAELYAHMCPAAVYERAGDRFIVNPANCV